MRRGYSSSNRKVSDLRSPHQHRNASHQASQQTESVDDPTSLTGHLMGHGHEDDAEREQQ